MSIWKMPINLELLTQRSKNTFAEYVGIEFTEVGDDYLKGTLPVDYRTKQPLGLLNGGVSAALAETVASSAANYCVDQSVCYCVGLEINANHLRPATAGVVTAIAKPLHLGNKTQVWEIKIDNEAGKLVCISRMTMAVVSRSEALKEEAQRQSLLCAKYDDPEEMEFWEENSDMTEWK